MKIASSGSGFPARPSPASAPRTGRSALRHGRRRVSTAAWALGLVPACRGLPVDRRRSGRRARVVAVVVAAVPRLREPSPGCFDPGEPRLYLRRVVPYQAGAWACRLGSRSPCWPRSAFRPRPDRRRPGRRGQRHVDAGSGHTGGAGTQQLLIVVALQQVASAASALSFSIGMQVGVTLVNTIVGVVAITLVFGTMRPAAIRAGFAQRFDGSRVA